MSNRPVQQKDIAEMLGVSVMTISKALRDHPDISDEMKKKVKGLAKKVGYRPNFVARNLSTQKTFTLGVVMPKIAHSFYSRILDGIYNEAKAGGYEVVLAVSQEDTELEAENIQNLLAMRVDGVLVSISQSTTADRVFEAVRRAKVALVFFDRIRELPAFSSVTVDNYGGAFSAVSYAIQAGYREIAHIGGLSHLSISQQRKAGYVDALEQHQIRVRPEWIVETRFGEEGGHEAFGALWNQADRPKLVFTVSDSVALGVYKAARERGLHIPDDIGVIGFSDIEIASLLSPALTTVHEPAERLGKEAAKLLIDEIRSDEKPKPQHLVLETHLQIRQSCRCISEAAVKTAISF